MMVVLAWRECLVAQELPHVYRDIVEIVADPPGPLQAKQIVLRIGLEATTAKAVGYTSFFISNELPTAPRPTVYTP